jgi:hypothetical protein
MVQKRDPRKDEKIELLEKLAGSLPHARKERAIFTRYLIEWLQKNVKLEYTDRTIKVDLPKYLDRALQELERGKYVDATPLAKRYLPQYEQASGMRLQPQPAIRRPSCSEQELIEEIVMEMFDIDTAADVRAYLQAEWQMVRRAWTEFAQNVFSQGLYEILQRSHSSLGRIGECDISHFCGGPSGDNRLITIEGEHRRSAEFGGRRTDPEGLTFVLGKSSLNVIEICSLLKSACEDWPERRESQRTFFREVLWT